MKPTRFACDWSFLTFSLALALALSRPAVPQVDAAEVEKPETPGELQSSSAQPDDDPELVRLYMLDGAVITGKLSVSEITVETDFGPLTIPLTKIREFIPGLNSHTELREKVDDLIAELESDDKQRHETALQKLIGMGPSIRRQIEQHRDSPNAELSKRIRAILVQLDELAEDPDGGATDAGDEWILEDSVETTSFTVVGEITPRNFTVENRYGTLKIKIGDIKSAERPLAVVAKDVRKSLTVDGSYLAQLRFKSSGVRVDRGDKVTVRAEGKISRAGSSNYASGPDGSSRFGYYSQNPRIQGGALVARIGSGGQPINVGSKATFSCTRSGLLRFAIGMRPDYVGRYQFVGQYNLKIHVSHGR